MTVADLIQLCENRLAALQAARNNHWTAGDIAAVANDDLQIAEVETTLTALQSLPV